MYRRTLLKDGFHTSEGRASRIGTLANFGRVFRKAGQRREPWIEIIRKLCFFFGGEGRRSVDDRLYAARSTIRIAVPADKHHGERRSATKARCRRKMWVAQQHEFAVAIHEVMLDLRALDAAPPTTCCAHDLAQVLGQIRVGLVDGLVLADHDNGRRGTGRGRGLSCWRDWEACSAGSLDAAAIMRRTANEGGKDELYAPHAVDLGGLRRNRFPPRARRQPATDGRRGRSSPPSAIRIGPPKISRAQGFQ